jgi:hypothetical protein
MPAAVVLCHATDSDFLMMQLLITYHQRQVMLQYMKEIWE